VHSGARRSGAAISIYAFFVLDWSELVAPVILRSNYAQSFFVYFSFSDSVSYLLARY
jgi:hypothetical protein